MEGWGLPRGKQARHLSSQLTRVLLYLTGPGLPPHKHTIRVCNCPSHLTLAA